MGTLISSFPSQRVMQQKNKVPGLILLKQIIENTSSFTGVTFFKSLVRQLAEVLGVHAVWVTQYHPDTHVLKAIAFWLDNAFVDQYEYQVKGTPCEPVLTNPDICHVPKNVIQLYPDDPDLKSLGAVSYMGLSLKDESGKVIGHLALLDNKPMPELPEVFAIFKIFASRAGAELRREIIHKQLKESESKLNRLVNGTSDAIIELDSKLHITQLNMAAGNLFRIEATKAIGNRVNTLFSMDSFNKLYSALQGLNSSRMRNSSVRIAGQLCCLKASGETFPADVNLSDYKFNDERFYVLYIRNVEETLSDKLKIERLHTETSMLREKIAFNEFDYIIGNSTAITKSLQAVKQVAPTDATVLIQGETGTGKELFARAVHEASRRGSENMVTMNCAALPSQLIESELFGHLKGAFTGATANREGRFTLADKGTIFLDEIGELPLELQAKLLRVIQEGEFQPVGSSRTVKVDVRIIAATHKDLKKQVEAGAFREDLYFRLNVFPIMVPPLREREGDVEILAKAFISKFSRKKGLKMKPLGKEDIHKLYAYPWPGNIRELQNIIERAIILSDDGEISLNHLLPAGPDKMREPAAVNEILTDEMIRQLEKENIIRALNLTQWKISGKDGAASLLNLPRTTLASKIKKYAIRRMASG